MIKSTELVVNSRGIPGPFIVETERFLFIFAHEELLLLAAGYQSETLPPAPFPSLPCGPVPCERSFSRSIIAGLFP